MALAHFRMLINEFLNKDLDIVPEEAPLIVLDSKSAMFMDNNGNDTNHTMHIERRVNIAKNSENFKMHKTDCCEGGMQLVETATNNFGEHDFTPRMKYIMVILDNLNIRLVQER